MMVEPFNFLLLKGNQPEFTMAGKVSQRLPFSEVPGRLGIAILWRPTFCGGSLRHDPPKRDTVYK